MIYGLYARSPGSKILRSAAARYFIHQHECYTIELDSMLSDMREVYTRYTDQDTDRERWHLMMQMQNPKYRIPILTRILDIVDKYPIRRPIIITDIDSSDEILLAQHRGIKTVHFLDGGGIDTMGCDHSIRALHIEEIYDGIDMLLKRE